MPVTKDPSKKLIWTNKGQSGPGAGGLGIGSAFGSVLGKAPKAAIKPPKVEMPTYPGGPDPIRPVIPGVERKDFGTPDRTGIDEAAKEAREAAKNFNDPTNTSAFQAAMGLASERGASVLDEVKRSGRDAASRAGYAGGFNAAAKSANADRFKATAEAGFASVASIRDQEADMYGKASSALSSLMSAYNAAMAASNVGFATTKAAQAQAQATIDLGFSKMIQDKNLTFMDATNAAKMLQAQLDQAYNGSLIDNAKYAQMSQSLAAQLASEQARLREQGRQFDLTRADSQRNVDLALKEAEKMRRERGVDPKTGKPLRSGGQVGTLGGTTTYSSRGFGGA